MATTTKDKLFLMRSWRTLRSEIDALLNEDRFRDTFKGSADRLQKSLDAMQTVAENTEVEVTEEIQAVEDSLLT